MLHAQEQGVTGGGLRADDGECVCQAERFGSSPPPTPRHSLTRARHTHERTHTCTHGRTHKCARIHTCTQEHTRACTAHTCTRMWTRMNARVCAHARRRRRRHARTHVRPQTAAVLNLRRFALPPRLPPAPWPFAPTVPSLWERPHPHAGKRDWRRPILSGWAATVCHNMSPHDLHQDFTPSPGFRAAATGSFFFASAEVPQGSTPWV